MTSDIEWIDMCDTTGETAAWESLQAELLRCQRSNELGLLIGSGISQFAPSGVPTGMQIANSIRDLLLQTLQQHGEGKRRADFRDIPFEVLMGRCAELDKDLAHTIAVELTGLRRPNPCHLQLARVLRRAAASGGDCHVVTTNYDVGIELAVGHLTWPTPARPRSVTRPQDLKGSPGTEIFHIHGIVSDPPTIVMDYKDEFVLATWKRVHLAELLRGRLLVIHGFSGHDLDVCRELMRIDLKGVVWIRAGAWDANWTSDARQLMTQGSGRRVAVAVDGRFERVFEKLGGPIRTQWKAKPIHRRLRKLTRTTTADFLTRWAYWTGLRAGHGSLAGTLPKTVFEAMDPRWQWELRSFGDYYAARHRTGANGQARAAQAARSAHDLPSELYHTNNQIEFLNRGGFAIDAWVVLGCAAVRHAARRRTIRESPSAHAEWNSLWASWRFVWPFCQVGLYCKVRLGISLRARVTPTDDGMEDLDKSLALDAMRDGLGNMDRLEERFRWLGQPARLINVYRVAALASLRWPLVALDSGIAIRRQKVQESVRWAKKVGDPCRLSRSRLVRLECHLLFREARVGLGVRSRDDSYAGAAWDQLAQAEVAWAYRVLPQCLHGWGMRLGRRRAPMLRRAGAELRLAALCALETM